MEFTVYLPVRIGKTKRAQSKWLKRTIRLNFPPPPGSCLYVYSAEIGLQGFHRKYLRIAEIYIACNPWDKLLDTETILVLEPLIFPGAPMSYIRKRVLKETSADTMGALFQWRPCSPPNCSRPLNSVRENDRRS